MRPADQSTIVMFHLNRYLLVSLLTNVLVTLCIRLASCDQFEPYALNGGLVSAVAGKNYVIFASDTRLTSGGYDILSRDYLSSRLWSAVPLHKSTRVCSDLGKYRLEPGRISSFQLSSPPLVWIASAGCAADCEALKRQVQVECASQAVSLAAKTSENTNENTTLLFPKYIANLLSQILYSRRAFPFYSFCILAGIVPPASDNQSRGSTDRKESHGGVVHVYDAIGSHEQVAVACAGTGREVMQPILDRIFLTEKRLGLSSHATKVTQGSRSDSSSMSLGKGIPPPVPTQVDCSVDDAIGYLLHAYRAVAEREINVGDSVILCILQFTPLSHSVTSDGQGFSSESMDNNKIHMNLLRIPLKTH